MVSEMAGKGNVSRGVWLNPVVSLSALRLLKLALTAFILCVGPVCVQVFTVVSIAERVPSTDLIIAGRLDNVGQTGWGDIPYSGRGDSRRDFEAEIKVDETIQGEFAGSRFIFSYSTPATDSRGNVGEGNLVAHTFRILFLKKRATDTPLKAPILRPCPPVPHVADRVGNESWAKMSTIRCCKES